MPRELRGGKRCVKLRLQQPRQLARGAPGRYYYCSQHTHAGQSAGAGLLPASSADSPIIALPASNCPVMRGPLCVSPTGLLLLLLLCPTTHITAAGKSTSPARYSSAGAPGEQQPHVDALALLPNPTRRTRVRWTHAMLTPALHTDACTRVACSS